MTNYYELLKLNSNASGAEIEERLDDQYAKWRSLVTHHDIDIVSQANQALNQLEEIRNTLMNSEKRKEYDRFLSQAQGTMAGLADPDVLIAQNPVTRIMAPPRPSNMHFPASEQKEVERTDAWICTDPKCKKANPTGTQF
jgi:curved DNA-binding protein CbpA